MKSFNEQNYKFEQNVLVTITLDDGSFEEFEDTIKGLNKGHALYLAQKNWPSAIIEAA